MRKATGKSSKRIGCRKRSYKRSYEIVLSFIRKPVTKLLSFAEEYFICLWKILFEIRFRFRNRIPSVAADDAESISVGFSDFFRTTLQVVGENFIARDVKKPPPPVHVTLSGN